MQFSPIRKEVQLLIYCFDSRLQDSQTQSPSLHRSRPSDRPEGNLPPYEGPKRTCTRKKRDKTRIGCELSKYPDPVRRTFLRSHKNVLNDRHSVRSESLLWLEAFTTLRAPVSPLLPYVVPSTSDTPIVTVRLSAEPSESHRFSLDGSRSGTDSTDNYPPETLLTLTEPRTLPRRVRSGPVRVTGRENESDRSNRSRHWSRPKISSFLKGEQIRVKDPILYLCRSHPPTGESTLSKSYRDRGPVGLPRVTSNTY